LRRAAAGCDRDPPPASRVHEGHGLRLAPGVWRGAEQYRFRCDHAVFILARLFLGHLADHFAAPKVALLSVLVEAVGLALLVVSPSLAAALAGAALTGFGYSLVYPALGVEAVRLVPPQTRGLAMGAYTAFLDVALGFGTPALGLLAERAGLGSTFVASVLAALGAAAIAGFLLNKSQRLHEQRLLA
jgi:MFS family permease